MVFWDLAVEVEPIGVVVGQGDGDETKGLADAILQGESWADGQSFAVAFGDCIIESESSPPLARLMDTHALNEPPATVLVEHVEHELRLKSPRL